MENSNKNNNKRYVNVIFDCDEGNELEELAKRRGIKLTPLCKQIILNDLHGGGSFNRFMSSVEPSVLWKYVVTWVGATMLFSFIMSVITIFLTVVVYKNIFG